MIDTTIRTGVLSVAALLMVAGCGANASSSDASEDTENGVGKTEEKYLVAPWAGNLNFYSFVRSRNVQVCIDRQPGVGTDEGTMQLIVQYAVFDWVSAVQSVASVPLNTGTEFTCQELDGVPLYDVRVVLNAGTGRAWNYGDHIDLFDGSSELFADTLHEFGHSFGLGDTYVEGVWSCQPNQPTSVMCDNASLTALTTDDIQGAQQTYRIANPYYYNYDAPRPIRSFASNRCLDVVGFGTDNGSGTQIWDCGPTNNQVWTYDANTKAIIGQGSNKCLDVAYSGTANGTAVWMWDCHYGPNQQWDLYPDGSVRSVASGKCLDVTGASPDNGTPIQIWDCGGGSNQLWSFNP
jgi:hypothetical protein